MIIDVHDYLFPILGGSGTRLDFKPTNVLGTASCLYKNVYITAGHTIRNSLNFESSFMWYIDKYTEQITNLPIEDYEIYDDIDLAIFEINIVWENRSFKLCNNKLEMLSDVFACGFPHGLDLNNQLLRNRAFKGYIVNYGKFHHFQCAPDCYELSFMCPKGISGAPLLKWDIHYDYLVYGYIIGNSNCEITVFSETERLTDGTTKTIYEKTESMKFGVAIQTNELIKRHPAIPKDLIITCL